MAPAATNLRTINPIIPTQQESVLKLRNTILALTVATLGAAALMSTTSSADARGFGGGFSRGGGMHGGGMHGGIGRVGHVGRIGNFARFSIRKPIFVTHWRHHRHWHVRWHRPWIYGVGTAALAAPVYAAVATPSAKPCTCLTKEYTQDNVVVFKDLCTKEMAAAPLGGQQSQAGTPSQ
jgi:hypothetical protein